MLRHRLDPTDPSGAAFTDVTGELTAADSQVATVRTNDGDVRVPWDAVVAGKELPPRPGRPGRPHVTISIDDLQRTMIDGLPGLLQLPIGDWVLRTAEGFTGRANSALVVGDPGRTVSDGVDRVVEAYEDLGQPALFQIPGPAGFDPTGHPVVAEVLGRGGRVFQRTAVMTAAVREVALTPPTPNTGVSIGPVADDAWWEAANPRTQERRDLVERLLAKVEYGQFLTVIRRGGGPVAAGRIAYSPGWVGVFDLHTIPEHRGHGFGRALVGEAARDAEDRGIRSSYLQVSADNEAAIGLY